MADDPKPKPPVFTPDNTKPHKLMAMGQPYPKVGKPPAKP
jgi:hypothetical protein